MLPGVSEFSTFLYWQGIIDVITTWTCWCFPVWCLILLNQSTSLLFPFSLITIFFKIPYFLWHQVSNSHIWLLHSILNSTFHYSYLFIFAAFVSSFSFSSSINVFTFLFFIWYFLSIRSMSVFLLSFPFFFVQNIQYFFLIIFISFSILLFPHGFLFGYSLSFFMPHYFTMYLLIGFIRLLASVIVRVGILPRIF